MMNLATPDIKKGYFNFSNAKWQASNLLNFLRALKKSDASLKLFEELDLSYNNLSQTEPLHPMAALFSEMKQNGLMQPPPFLFSEGLVLAELFKTYPAWKHVRLRAIQLSDAEWRMVLMQLAQCPALMELDISENCLGALAVEGLHFLIKHSKTLKVLNFQSGTLLSQASLGPALVALRENTTLKRLNLLHLRTEFPILKPLLEILNVNKTLEQLLLDREPEPEKYDAIQQSLEKRVVRKLLNPQALFEEARKAILAGNEGLFQAFIGLDHSPESFELYYLSQMEAIVSNEEYENTCTALATLNLDVIKQYECLSFEMKEKEALLKKLEQHYDQEVAHLKGSISSGLKERLANAHQRFIQENEGMSLALQPYKGSAELQQQLVKRFTTHSALNRTTFFNLLTKETWELEALYSQYHKEKQRHEQAELKAQGGATQLQKEHAKHVEQRTRQKNLLRKLYKQEQFAPAYQEYFKQIQTSFEKVSLDLNTTDKKGNSLLHYAFWVASKEKESTKKEPKKILRYLLDKEADISKENQAGQSPTFFSGRRDPQKPSASRNWCAC